MEDHSRKVLQSWAKFLNPDQLRSSLVRTSIYLTAYEFLRQALIEHLEGFFSDGFDAKDPDLSESYRTEVLSLHQMPFFASAIWFRNHGALTDQDLQCIREIREHRNFVAHHIPEILGSIDSDVRPDLLAVIAEIVQKIDLWWIREIEVPTNPDFDGMAPDAIDPQSTFSLRMAVLDLLLRVADGDDDGLRKLYDQFTAKAEIH